jgi:hypothetical protein
MPAPLVAASLAARLIARQLAEKSAKKLATKATSKGLSNTFGARGTVKKAATKMNKAAVKVGPKNSVKVVKPSTLRDVKNKTSNVTSQLRKSGEAAKRSAADVRTGMPNATVKIKSGGNIKPATPKKTIASNPGNVGNAPSAGKVKWDLETAKLYAKKGKTVKINSAKK